jgi:hypothetical protein
MRRSSGSRGLVTHQRFGMHALRSPSAPVFRSLARRKNSKKAEGRQNPFNMAGAPESSLFFCITTEFGYHARMYRDPTTELEQLLIQLQRMGYRTQTAGNRVMLEEPEGHARIFISTNQLETLVPLLSKARQERRKVLHKRRLKTGKKTRAKGQRQGKVRLRSQAKAISSVYRQREQGSGAPPCQGGLPGLGKHH